MTCEFAETGCARLPGFLSPPALTYLLQWLETAHFELKNETHNGNVFGTTLFVPSNEKSVVLLHFALNRQPILEMVEQTTGCRGLRRFTGRIHRTNAGSIHHIDWHDDAVDGRSVGITIHLGSGNYTGGLFQLRDPEGKIRSEIGCAPPGDAFLFRIGAGWQHRLTPVISGERTVATGWFLT